MLTGTSSEDGPQLENRTQVLSLRFISPHSLRRLALPQGLPDEHFGFDWRRAVALVGGLAWAFAVSFLGEGAPWWALPLFFAFGE